MRQQSSVSAAFVVVVVGIVALRAQEQTAFGPATDRVGLPNYSSGYTVVRTFATPQDKVMTVYANAPAAGVTDLAKLPYPYGSIIVFERRNAATDANGSPLRDEKGQIRAGEIFQIDVMRREKGFGVDYRESRTGEWEFASYKPDGTFLTPPDRTSACAACHVKAGSARDFVFRGRFPAVAGG